jgi:hypothetical protein
MVALTLQPSFTLKGANDMIVDRYTKVILTYIAVCLSLITLKEIGVIPRAYAQAVAQPVFICNPGAQRKCADVRSTGDGSDGLVIAVPR